MESPEPVMLDLDEVEVEIKQRWFVWTAAGLSVHPTTWTDQSDGAPVGRAGRSDVTTPASLGLQVSRPNAHVDIVLGRDGWVEVAVLRPEADAVVQASAQVESAAEFADLLDRSVELITWSGVTRQGAPASDPARPERADRWVVGYDGDRWSNGS